MFNVFVNNGMEEMPDDDILYIVCKEGIYLKKKLGIMESITPVKNVSTLDSVEMMATMHIKPIPAYQFAQVESFFRAIYKEYRSEAIVLLFYNEERKVYKIVPPHQKVNGASVDYNRAITIDGFNMIGDIHSHANMSAFHSGTDDNDEKSFDGLHITIGNCGSENVSISASIVSNGQRFIVEPSDYINKLALTRDIDEKIEKPYSQVFIWNKNQKKMVPKPGKQKTYTVRRFDKRYEVNVSSKYRKFDPKWMELVEHRPYIYNCTYGADGNYWQNWRGQSRGWPAEFDANAWANFNRNQAYNKTTKPPKTTKPITFPPQNQSEDGVHEEIIDNKGFNPCLDCVFKEHKIDWELEQLTDEDNNSFMDTYECTECSAYFSTSEDMPVCPNCKVDDHLILIDENDFKDENEDDGWYYRCEKCNILFYTVDSFPKCKQCKSDKHLVEILSSTSSDDGSEMEEKTYKYKCPHCGSEMDELNNDNECPFCSQKVEDPIEQAGQAAEETNRLSKAIKADEELERIAIPDQDHIPINRVKRKTKKGIFSKLFNKGNE